MYGITNVSAASGSAGEYLGGTALSPEATVNDDKARFPVIQKTSQPSGEVKIFETTVPLRAGLYSIMFRVKISDNTGTDNLISIKAKVNSNEGTLINEAHIKPKMFSNKDKYQTFGFCINADILKTDKVFLSMNLLSSQKREIVSLDYVVVGPTYTSITSVT